MAKYTVHEKRRHLRVNESVRTHAHAYMKMPHDIDTSTINVSRGGMCFTADQPLDSGTQVEIESKVDGQTTLFLQGSVVWSKKLQFGEPYTVGIELNDTSPDLREWDAFMTSHRG